ncbi:alanine racemase [Yaniella flava]|uniref:Alanine racemase n=1 Tax=Yaniella flava TaxID=287930 RepID=A0ABP5FKI0_9MICC|nr:alanine racemase [Micrococcaceae bacterium]
MVKSWTAAPERWVTIDHSALAHNIGTIAQSVKPAQVMAVVKADGYGHGAVEVAQTAVAAGATWLGTAHVREALELREAGIAAPLLAWLHTINTPFEAAVAHNIDLGVSGPEIEAVADAARATNLPARVHLKIDTGLSRNGAVPEAWDALCRRAAELQQSGLVRVVGVFTHFAVADDPVGEPAVDEQLRVYHEAVDTARKHGLTVDVRHVANSPALLSRPDTHLDMVRAGVAIYGLSPFADRTATDLGLRPVMSFGTTVAHNKPADEGTGVSYGYAYRCETPTRLALIPCGYGDGVPRIAAGAPVWIGGKYYRVAGRIAMDQFVVDLNTDRDDETTAPVGAEVELFGAQSGIPSDAWAQAADTINYELVTRIGTRVPRVHKQWV